MGANAPHGAPAGYRWHRFDAAGDDSGTIPRSSRSNRPRRIDILTSISGVSFDEAAAHAIEGKLGSVRVRFIGKAAMARNKLASGRPKDLVDAELLQSDD